MSFENSLQVDPNANIQERYVPLSFILENAIQRTYHQLTLMIDM